MTYTQAQIDKANAVGLEKFLRAQGETLVRSGKEYRWKAHDSLTVCGNKWFRHSQSKGGLPVDFVMEFYGKSFPEAVQMLTGEPGEAQPEADPAPSPAFRLPLRNVTNANILNYLTQERKLSPSLVNFFIAAGDIYEDSSHHNVVFVGRDADGHPRYASNRGINEKFRQDDDIRSKLLTAGVPEQEIEFIHNADTENKKAELFSKVRSGQVRVLLGSTAKMGAGTNVQTLLVAVHHLDVGWRPSDMTQRNGRIIRQGNQNKQVYVYNYVTESTFDAYLYQTLENKQKFISQIMTSKSPMRSCDDIDEQALSYAEIKALCAGDPRIREKMDLDVQVAKLKVLRGDFQNQKYRLEDKLLKTFPEEIHKQKTRIAALQQDSQIAATHPQDKENFCGMTIKGMRLLSQRIPTENTFIITLSTTPLHWTAPENSGIFCCPG